MISGMSKDDCFLQSVLLHVVCNCEMSRVYYGVTNKDAEMVLEIQIVLTYNYPHSQATPHMHYMYFTFQQTVYNVTSNIYPDITCMGYI